MNKTEKYNPAVLEYVALFVIIIVLIAGFFQLKNQEINFCRNIFKGLMGGRVGVQKFIDWEHLKALDTDVGADYTRLPDDKERLNYKKAFIMLFARGFHQGGGNLRSFTNWRIYNKDNSSVTVAADYLKHNKTILFTLAKSGKKKLVSLQWR